MSKPFETDELQNVVNYNWIVDGILKNSTPYETHRDINSLSTSNRGRKKNIEKQKSIIINKRGRKSNLDKKLQANYQA